MGLPHEQATPPSFMLVSIAAPSAPEPVTLTPRQSPHKARFFRCDFRPYIRWSGVQLRAGV